MARPVGYYAERANLYAQLVTDGEIAAGKLVRLACTRHLKDLSRAKFQYVFDVAAAERPCRFIERLPHVKGEWAKRKELLVLELWQCFIVCSAFGWLDKKTGLRRFTSIYIEVARKNAKSTLSAAVALYMLVADGEPGAEVYCTGQNKKQSSDIVFATAKRMAQMASGFLDYYGARVFEYNIHVLATASKFEPLHAKGESLDGLNVHCSVNDELHAQKRRELHDVIDTGTGARQQPLLWDITTAGTDTAGICFEVRSYAIKVLERTVRDESVFALIYTFDEKDNWQDEKVWQKCNPNWNVSVYPMHVRRLFKKAKAEQSFRNTFLTKHLNVWCSADDPFFDMLAYDRAADHSMTLDDFAGQRCWVPIDLASKVDIAAQMQMFADEIDGKLHVHVFGNYYLPETTVQDSPNSQYQGWARRKLLTVTPGNITDYAYIEKDLLAMVEGFEVVEVPYDPYQATQFATRMGEEGLTMVEVRQTVLSMSEPMKLVDALIKDGRFHHNGDPVLAWMFSNVVAHYDVKDNVYPRKQRRQNKIDGAVAVIMGLNRIIADRAAGASVYDERGVYSV